MKKKKLISILMTAVLTFTSVAPQSALYANAEGDVIIEDISEEDGEDETVSNDEAEEDTLSDNTAEEESISENECVSGNDAESISEDEAASVSENEAVSENEVVEGTVSGNAADEKELPSGIKGMPEGYALSEREAEIKADMINHDVLVELKNAVAGVDYVEDQVYCIAETEEYAQQIAEAYGIELVEYAYSVAIFNIDGSGRDVYETIELSMDDAYSLPPLTPDYICQLKAEENEDRFINEMYAIRSGQSVNMPGDWDSVRDLLGDGLDPLLKPNDPNYQWWHDMMDTYAAWGVYGTDCSESGIKVAVIDGRVYDSHEDLSGNVKVTDVAGGGSSAINGHGTQIAGIIGAKAGNALGGAGIAPGVQIYSLSCAKEEGTIEGAYVTACLKYLENSDINIACMGFAGSVYDANQKDAIQKAYEKGITVLAPAGEDNSKQDQYDHVISVGAVKQDGSKMITSGSAKDQADVYAPGAEMMSTYSDGYYKAEKGTSMACAAAAGACALYMSVNGSVGPDEMKEVLTQNTIKGKSLEKGVGIVNISEMLGNGAAGPKLELVDPHNLNKIIEGGKSGSATVDSWAYIKVIPMLRNGEENTDRNMKVFYTTNGEIPSFTRDGVPSENTFFLPLEEHELYNEENAECFVINIDKIVNVATDKRQKITIKVVAVTEFGEISKVTTLKLKVNPVWYSISLYIPDVPDERYTVSAGGSLQLKAQLIKRTNTQTKVLTLKKLNWEVIEGKDIARFGKKNGLLNIYKGKTGMVVFRCSCKIEGHTVYSESRTIKVANNVPIKSIKLSESSMELYTGMEVQKVNIASAIDNNGEDILSEDYVQYRWKSSNSNVAYTVDDYGKETGIYPKGKGIAKITCMAMDGSGKTATIKVIVRQKVVSIEINGQDSIAEGSSTLYKAKVYGKRDKSTNQEIASPNDKGITWFLNGNIGCTELDGGAVRIDSKKGVVKVGKNHSINEFYVCAIANDGSNISNNYHVRITNKKTSSIIVTTEESEDAYQIRLDKKGSIASMQLYTVDSTASPVNETKRLIKVISDSHAGVKWKSSNEAVVSVVDQFGGEAELRAIGSGSTTITCAASDGSGKKASFKVKVIIPVSHLMMTNEKLIVYPGGMDGISHVYLEKGKATNMQVTAGDSYGKPDNPKVKWSYAIVGYDENNRRKALDEATIEKAEKAKLFSVKGSKVKINRNYDKLCTQNGLPDKIGLMITATSTDGSNVSDSMLIIPVK